MFQTKPEMTWLKSAFIGHFYFSCEKVHNKLIYEFTPLKWKRNNPFLKNIIASGEKCVFYDNAKDSLPQRRSFMEEKLFCQLGSPQYSSWVFKLQSDTQCRLIFF